MKSLIIIKNLFKILQFTEKFLYSLQFLILKIARHRDYKLIRIYIK